MKNLLKMNENMTREHLSSLSNLLNEMKQDYYEHNRIICESLEEYNANDVTPFSTLVIEEVIKKVIN